MTENNHSANPADPVAPRSTSARRTKLWVIVMVMVVLLSGTYVWWAKPAWLFARTTGQQSEGFPGAPGGPGGGGGGGMGGPGGFGGRGGQTAPVGAAKARTTDVKIYVPALGSVLAQNTATVRVRIDGQVLTKLHFKEGEMVKEGQLLAELDARSSEVQLALAQGQQARDLAQLQNAKIDLERYRNLLAQDSIAKQQVDAQEALVRQLEGTARIDQANVDAARLQLSYTRVTAPISGRVGLKQIDVGNVARSSDTNGIAIITQVQPLNVVFTIPEVNIPQVLKQMQAGIELPVEAWDREQKNKIASGVLVTVDNQIDATTGTIKLKARFTNEDMALFPNQFVNVRMLLETRHGATVVPTSAMQRGTDGNFVYIVQQDKSIAVRKVQAGAIQGEDTMIADHSVKPGEIVVIDGTDRLREGMKVEAIVRAEQPAVLPTEEELRARNRARRMQQMAARNGGKMPDFGGGAASDSAAGGQDMGRRPMNPDGTPRQWTGPRPDGQGGGRMNPDGTPRHRPDGPRAPASPPANAPAAP